MRIWASAPEISTTRYRPDFVSNGKACKDRNNVQGRCMSSHADDDIIPEKQKRICPFFTSSTYFESINMLSLLLTDFL